VFIYSCLYIPSIGMTYKYTSVIIAVVLKVTAVVVGKMVLSFIHTMLGNTIQTNLCC